MITELPRSVGHVWKCQHIADYLGMKLFEDVGCWPIAIHEWEGRGKEGHPFSKEHPQFKSSLTYNLPHSIHISNFGELSKKAVWAVLFKIL